MMTRMEVNSEHNAHKRMRWNDVVQMRNVVVQVGGMRELEPRIFFENNVLTQRPFNFDQRGGG
jgi:hypothetical protein